MSTKIIVSYDGTANEDDAITLGRLFGDAGAEVSLAYVRHTPEPDSVREAIAQAEAESCSTAASSCSARPARSATSSPTARRPQGLASLAEREGADVIVFCSDSHTAKGHVADRQLRRASARGRPHRGRDRAGRPRRARQGARIQRIVAVGDADGGARQTAAGARRRARRDGRAGRQRPGRPARDRLARRRRAGPRLDELLRVAPDRDRHLPGARRAPRRGARVQRAAHTPRRRLDALHARRTAPTRGRSPANGLGRACRAST